MATQNVNVDVSGPLFDGRAQAILEAFEAEAAWQIAKEGRNDLGLQYLRVFKNPTGYHESRTRAEPTPYGARIYDGNAVYGPWLEGNGSRNYPVTSFKGYHSFAIVTKELERKAVAITERTLQPYLQQMGGS